LSDRYGRRAVLLTALGASALAYLIFAWGSLPRTEAGSRILFLWLLFLSRVVQGAGGGTVGVIQAYVADSTEPRDRARALGWLSAATNVGVTIGPALGSWSLGWGPRAPGLVAAVVCAVNMGFVWFYVRESHVVHPHHERSKQLAKPAEATLRVVTHPREAAPRLIWIYAIGMGAFSGFTTVLALFLAVRFGVTEHNIGYFFAWTGVISVLVRAFFLGKAVDRLGEVRLARLGQVLLASGLALIPVTAMLPRGGGPRFAFQPGAGALHFLSFDFVLQPHILALAAVMALIPLGTAFTFPCVTALLSQVIDPRERGVMMGVQQSFGGGARVLFPLLAGWTFDHLGTPYPFWTSAVLVLGTILLSFGIDPRRPDPLPGGADVPAQPVVATP
jgi:MFS family permease